MTDTQTPGRATPEATRGLAVRFAESAPHGYTTLGSAGLTVSRVGFGCYRVDDLTPEHSAALEAALAGGCNLIDTSSNYTDGGSERLVGAVVGARREGADEGREGVVVVSKIGYVQGSNMDLALERERSGSPFPEIVRYMDGCWHCIHPEFLRDQLARSRRRLRLETIDVCLLHNPEYFLSDAKRRHAGDLEKRREEFYRRLRAAFCFLEEAAGRGQIGCYGVSSNTAVVPPDDPEATSVSRMVEAAVAAGGLDHRFRVLQVPLNLLETGGALTPNSGPDGTRTALEEAASGGLGVLINRPLNALSGNRLLRLAAIEMPGPQNALEAEVARRLRRWTASIVQAIDPVLPESRRCESLSRKAIWVVASTPGVSTVLVGMRREPYVRDALEVLAWPPLACSLEAYRRLQGESG
jgi:aryl-alcohol dehydrogenase-like predicted oxidoreductase